MSVWIMRAAEAVLILHLAWICFLVSGVVLLRRHPRWRVVHLAGVAYAVAKNLLLPWPCPLTYLEQWCLERAGAVSYRGSFIAHYVEPLVYPETTHFLLIGVIVLLGLATFVAYFTVPAYGPPDGKTFLRQGCLLRGFGRLRLKTKLL